MPETLPRLRGSREAKPSTLLRVRLDFPASFQQKRAAPWEAGPRDPGGDPLVSARQSTSNGQPQKIETPADQIAAAIESERALAERARAIWVDKPADALSTSLFLDLWPLMREPIPSGFISEVTAGKGKPYPSKGIRSLQVQINRMDAVWTPLWWAWRTEWIEPHLAEVTVWIGETEEHALVRRSARGGMNAGSTVGNHFKGTETNAAKMAFARLGCGHEVYIGAADFDPDTDEDAAKAQEKGAEAPPVPGIAPESLLLLREKFDLHVGEDPVRLKEFKVKLGALGVSARSRDTALASLTPAQAIDLDAWFDEFQEVPA